MLFGHWISHQVLTSVIDQLLPLFLVSCGSVGNHYLESAMYIKHCQKNRTNKGELNPSMENKMETIVLFWAKILFSQLPVKCTLVLAMVMSLWWGCVVEVLLVQNCVVMESESLGKVLCLCKCYHCTTSGLVNSLNGWKVKVMVFKWYHAHAWTCFIFFLMLWFKTNPSNKAT